MWPADQQPLPPSSGGSSSSKGNNSPNDDGGEGYAPSSPPPASVVAGAGAGVGAGAGAPPPPQQQQKRTRVLLSCAPCRGSKLKCDRAVPCSQCAKKGRAEACVYAPRPSKQKPARSMAARLKRLEGMVREMIDTEPGSGGGGGGEAAAAAALAAIQAAAPGVGGNNNNNKSGSSSNETPNTTAPAAPAGGVLVQGQKATNYVGATHFMAILDDIEDLKNYFEDSEDEGEDYDDPYENIGPTEVVFGSRGVLKDKEELLRLLPEKNVIDRLMNRYFHSNSPSQHILHRPTFTKQYNQFWQNPSEASLHWIALLFMVTGLGVFFSTFQSPHELEGDSPVPAMDRFRQYRGAAGWALIWGKYSQPNIITLQCFLLYVEAEFLVNRTHQTNCYLLSSVLIRLMLKMGLHRDASKLPNISIYEGEMRRRLWHLAVQIDLLVAFYLGLPSMIQGIESDTAMPRHLMDSDFGEDSTELPPSRPMTDYTQLTYPIHKSHIARVFGLVARHAHALTIPSYTEVMKVDKVLEDTWKNVPGFMKVKPIEESVTDPIMQVIQRFGLAALYLKARCVLHRRYLSEAVPNKERAYSRRACFESARELLEHQNTLYTACLPGGLLSTKGWFISSLAINDFLLGDMIVALVLQNEHYPETGGNFEWMSQGTPLPTKDELLRILERSYGIWTSMAQTVPDCRKAADVVQKLLHRVYTCLGIPIGEDGLGVTSAEQHMNDYDGAESLAGLNLDSRESRGPSTGSASSFDVLDHHHISPDFDMADPSLGRVMESMQVGMGGLDPSWMMNHNGFYDWNQFDALTRAPADAVAIPQMQADQQLNWLGGDAADDFEFLMTNSWTQP